MRDGKLLRVVEVEWVDSHGLSDVWHADDDIEGQNATDILVCHSAGYVYRETDDILVLALSVNPGQWGSVMVIPKVAIRKLSEIRPVPEAT